jgi:hypothetical protein
MTVAKSTIGPNRGQAVIVKAPGRVADLDAPSSMTTSQGGPGGVVVVLTAILQVT